MGVRLLAHNLHSKQSAGRIKVNRQQHGEVSREHAAPARSSLSRPLPERGGVLDRRDQQRLPSFFIPTFRVPGGPVQEFLDLLLRRELLSKGAIAMRTRALPTLNAALLGITMIAMVPLAGCDRDVNAVQFYFYYKGNT